MDGRDGARTPLPWNGDWKEPWLPLGDNVAPVASQRHDPTSFLSFCRDLIARRSSSLDLLEGAYDTLPAPEGVWAFRRGARTVVAVNLSDETAALDLGGSRELAPWEAVMFDV